MQPEQVGSLKKQVGIRSLRISDIQKNSMKKDITKINQKSYMEH